MGKTPYRKGDSFAVTEKDIGVIGGVNPSGNVEPLQTDATGNLLSVLVDAATGGATPYHHIASTGDNATNLKNAPGVIYIACAFNKNAAPAYLKLYDKASTPTVGTDTPVQVYMIPGNAAGAGFVLPVPSGGLKFSNGISFGIVTGMADADDTGVTSGDVCINFGYL